MPKRSYSSKQRKLAAVAPPRDKITAADLRKKRKRSETYHSPKKSIRKTF
jgi:hypothetical protein